MSSPPLDAAGSLEDYDFHLPREQIAQEPPRERGDSRLLVLYRSEKRREHRRFDDLPRLVHPGDLVVLNDTRVVPARLRIRRATGARGELLLLEADENALTWQVIGRPAKALRVGEELSIEGTTTTARTLHRDSDVVHVEFLDASRRLDPHSVLALCERVGEAPLPPYISRSRGDKRLRQDRDRYQTVFARHPGSAAAPTAGLHFTRKTLRDLETVGAVLAHVTLHVGLGTFAPLTEATFARPTLHRERIEVSVETLRAVAAAKRERRRIIAVGTTSARVLESLPDGFDATRPVRESTDLFIKPGYSFRTVGALLTNFHLPRSSLLLLVSAFAGRDAILEAYRDAVRERYRFYSYGDAMLIL